MMVFSIFIQLGVCQDSQISIFILFTKLGEIAIISSNISSMSHSLLTPLLGLHLHRCKTFFFCPTGHRLMCCHHFSLTCLIISTDLFQGSDSFPCNLHLVHLSCEFYISDIVFSVLEFYFGFSLVSIFSLS